MLHVLSAETGCEFDVDQSSRKDDGKIGAEDEPIDMKICEKIDLHEDLRFLSINKSY